MKKASISSAAVRFFCFKAYFLPLNVILKSRRFLQHLIFRAIQLENNRFQYSMRTIS